jgi:hypothetical protein
MKYPWNQLGNTVGRYGGGDVIPTTRIPFYKQISGQIFKDDVDGFPSFSDISCMVYYMYCPYVVNRYKEKKQANF